MKKYFFRFAFVLGLLAALVVAPRFAGAQDDLSQLSAVAGPTTTSIQSSVDRYRDAVSVLAGRREINWDGGSQTNEATTVSGNPFAGFLISRGALFTTPDGTGFVQAPAGTDVAPGGLAGVFGLSRGPKQRDRTWELGCQDSNHKVADS